MLLKRRLNVRLFICLLGGLVIVVPSAHFLHAYQVKRTAGFLLTQAKAAEDQKDLLKAIGYYSRYVALKPKEGKPRGDYGLVLANDNIAVTPKALQRAYFMLDQALRLEPDQPLVRRRVVQLALHHWLNRTTDAAEHLDKLFESGVKDAELYALRAQCYEATGDLKEARKSYEAALGQPSKVPEHFARLAYLLQQHAAKVMVEEKTGIEVQKGADDRIDEMLKLFPESHQAWLFSAAYHKTFTRLNPPEKREKRISHDIEKAVQIAPTELDAVLAAADLEMNRKNAPEARAYLEKGLEKHPKEWRLYRTLATVEMEDKKPAAAVAALERGLAKVPKNVDLLWNLAHLHLQEGQDEEAGVLIARLEKDAFPQQELDYLRGRLHVNKREWKKAVALLKRVYPQFLGRYGQLKDWFSFDVAQQCNFLLARCYEGMSDPDRAGATYSQIVARNPSSLGGRLGLARMEWAVGRLDNALREYHQLRQIRGAPAAAWIECAQLLIYRNLKNSESNWSAVEQVLDLAAQIKPTPVEVAILRAEVLASKKEFGQARELLGKAYQDEKERPVQIWVGLSILETQRGKLEEALAILNEAERHHGNHLELLVARTRYWARRGGPEALRALSKISQDLDKLADAEQRQLGEELATAYRGIGEKKLAEAQWRQIASKRPSDIGSRLMLFDLAMQAGDEDTTKQVIKELKEIEDDEGTLWKYCHACRLIGQAPKSADKDKDLTEASGLLSVVGGRRAGWYRVAVAQGQIKELQGKYQAAIDKYREAIAMGAQDPAVIKRVVLLLSASGRHLEVDELLQKLKDPSGTFGDMTRVAADVALAKKDTGLALALAEKAVSAESKDFREQIWLGQILWAAGKLPEAEAAFRKAIELNKESPDPWVALVRFAKTIGDEPKAKAALEAAHKAIPPDPGLLPLAYCHELLNEREKAKELYEKALDKRPEDTNVLQNVAFFHLRAMDKEKDPKQAKRHLEKAKKYLGDIIQLKSDSPSQTTEARRILAMILHSSGDYAQTKAALKLLGVVDEVVRVDELTADSNLQDELAKAIILARQSNPRSRQQAVVILEKIAALKRLSSDEQFLLAHLYESLKEWPKMRDQMVLLIKDTESKLAKAPKEEKSRFESALGTYLTFHCSGLIRREALLEAQIWLSRLEKLEPESLRTLATKARLLHKQGEGAKAIDPLVALADKNPALARSIAKLLEELGRNKEAEKMLLQFLTQASPKSPESVLTLAQFLGRQNRPDEALAVCEKAWLNCKPEAVAETCVVILYTAKSGKEHWERVSAWLEKESTKNPTNVSVLSHLSAVRRLQEDYPAVMDLCRRILALDKNDTTTMNNLAWMLALHDHDGEAAFKWIKQAIELDGPVEWLLDTRAVVYMKRGMAREAVRDMEDTIAELPNAQRYFHLAQAHMLAGNISASLSAFHQATELWRGENVLRPEDVVDPLEREAYRELRNKLKG